MTPSIPQRGGSVEKQGLSRYVSRLKSALTGESAKSKPSIAATDRCASAEESGKVETAACTQHTISRTSPEPMEVDAHAQSVEQPAMILRRSTSGVRSGKIASKHALMMEPQEWDALGAGVELVHKPIRMRVTRTCHQCGAIFGACRVCIVCAHTKCEKCARYPRGKTSKGTETVMVEKNQSTEMVPVSMAYAKGSGITSANISHDDRLKRKHRDVSMPNQSAGMHELVRKRRMQARRMLCHLCETPLLGTSMCTGCKHERCSECPRETAKTYVYPDGYAGETSTTPPSSPPRMTARADRVYRCPIRTIRYVCHACSTTFKSETLTCTSCHHERCDDCLRFPPKRAEQVQKPDVMQRVGQELMAMDFEGTGQADEDESLGPDDEMGPPAVNRWKGKGVAEV